MTLLIKKGRFVYGNNSSVHMHIRVGFIDLQEGSGV